MVSACTLGVQYSLRQVLNLKQYCGELATSFPNYEKMLISCGVDRAGGDEGERIREQMKRRRSLEEVTESESVNDNDNLVELNGQSHSPEQDDLLAANSACSKRTKRVSKEQKNCLEELVKAIYKVVEALDRGNEAILQGNVILEKMANTKLHVPQLSSEELWKMFEECGCDSERLIDIYYFLMVDVKKLRAAVECPASMRKQVIMKMFYSSQ